MDEDGPWTISELSDLVLRVLHSSGLLEADYAGQPSKRVRSIPDERTIRWYTTIGLLDRPVAMRGRTALYGRRHLYQLVAVKRLQAQGRSLAEVQEDLVGATDATLEGIAHLPERLMEITLDEGPTLTSSNRLVSGRMVLTAPDQPAGDDDTVTSGETFATVARSARLVAEGAESDTVRKRRAVPSGAAAEPTVAAAGAAAEVVPAMRLGGGVTLLLGAATRALNVDDLAMLEQAAGPLLELVRARGLDGPDPGGTRDEHPS